MIHSYIKSKKGFTLFEILLVITIMAILAVAALTSTINAQRQFVFINNFKEILSKVREARMYAVTQKAVNLGGGEEGIPPSYGVYIKNESGQLVVRVFADLATSTLQNGYDSAGDVVFGQPYSLDATKYTLTVDNETAENNSHLSINNGDTLTLLYSPTEIKVVAVGKKTDASSVLFSGSHITLTLTDTKDPLLTKNITLFLRSGIAEAIQNVTNILD